MMKNPHPEFILDEISGIKVPNQRHYDWNEGYNAALIDVFVFVVGLARTSFMEVSSKLRRMTKDDWLRWIEETSGDSSGEWGKEQGER